MQFNISQPVYNALISYGNKFPSQEVCGALIGISDQSSYTCTDFIKLTNVSTEDQGHNYVPDPNEFFNVLKTTTHFSQKNTRQLVGIFHTHPHHLPIPSITDIEGAGYAGIYIIYSPKYTKLNAFYYDGNETHRAFQPVLKKVI